MVPGYLRRISYGQQQHGSFDPTDIWSVLAAGGVKSLYTGAPCYCCLRSLWLCEVDWRQPSWRLVVGDRFYLFGLHGLSAKAHLYYFHTLLVSPGIDVS